MFFINNFLIGIAIGSGSILPGLSSGVLCVILGIYEKLLNSILNFFNSPRENIKFLFPIFCGLIIGIFIFAKMLNYLFINYPLQTKSIFIGFILGSLPSLIKEIRKKSEFKKNYILYSIIAFSIGIISVIIEKNYSINLVTSNLSIFYLILSGFSMSLGVIVPGVSSTIILMLMGAYSTYLYSISSLYLPVLIPMGIGLSLGCYIFMKITQYLFKHYYNQTFYSILGFTLGSTLVLLPNIENNLSGVICITCITLGITIVNILQ